MKSYLEFNRLYVIESLNPNEGDRLTGTDLLEELSPICSQLKCLTSGLFTVNSKTELNDALGYILSDCDDKHSPIIHFEIHGTDDKRGLYLNNGDVYTWKELLDYLSRINYKSNCNLFVTFAVCFSLHILEYIRMYSLMPFCGTIGTLDEQYETDLFLKFNEFYKVLLTSLDIDKAFDALVKTNPNAPSKYSNLKADTLFNIAQNAYLSRACTRYALKNRARDEIKEKNLVFSNSNDRIVYVNNFVKTERLEHEQHYQKSLYQYFMFNQFPENKKRFIHFDTTDELVSAMRNIHK